MKKRQKTLIREKAEELKSKFWYKWAAAAFVLILYSVIVTLFTATKSERCMSDVIAAGSLIAKIFKGAYNVVSSLVSSASSIGDYIPQPIISTVVGYLLGALTAALCIAAPIVVLYFGGKALVMCYTAHCWDVISPLVLLACLAVLVWGAEYMPFNVVLLLVISHVAYIIVRWYIDGYKESRGL